MVGSKTGEVSNLAPHPFATAPCRSSGTKSGPRLGRMQMLPDKELAGLSNALLMGT